jgi:hypothetical protein
MGEHIQTEKITCPYCDVEFIDSLDRWDCDEYECKCGKTFFYIRQVFISYNSYRDCTLNGEDHDRVESTKHMDDCSKCDMPLEKNHHASPMEAHQSKEIAR